MNATNKSLLIIDDEQDLLFVLSVRLKNQGYCVDTTSDPLSAMELIDSKNYDFIFCDLSIPGKTSSFDVLNFMKLRGKKSRFYFITGHAEGFKLVQQAIQEVGKQSILEKPLDFKQMIELLES